jgi:hypothetical protein
MEEPMTKHHNGHDLLEQSILCTLKSAQSSAEIATLIGKVEADLVQTEQEARAAERTATDIEASPDAGAALNAAATARQRYDRLVAVLPKLKARLSETQAKEYSAQWEPQYRAVAAARDALQAEFTEQVTSAINLIVDLIHCAQAINKQGFQINETAPAGDHRRIEPIDLRFSNRLVLVDLEGRQVWPDPRAAIEAALLVAGTVPEVDPREWWERNEERQRQQQDANQEMAKHYAALTRTQEERQNRELNERRR